MRRIALNSFAGFWVLLFITVQPRTVRAKTDVWKLLGISGEAVTALAVAPANPGTVYVGTTSGAVFKISDGAQSRLAMDLESRSNPVTAIAVDPKNSNLVYVATADGIFKSTTAGASWTSVSGVVTGSVALVIDPQNSSFIYAAADKLGLFKSEDAGVTWALTSLAASVQKLVIDPQSSAILYAGTSIGVVKSIDRGATWTSYTWTRGMIRGLAIDPWTPATLYAGAAAGGVFKSTNGGLSWTESGLSFTAVYGIVVDIQEASTVYAATEAGPFKSIDAGRTWVAINDGLASRTTILVGDLALCKVYIGTGSGVFETDIGPVLTLHSNLCIGDSWSVVVSHASGGASLRLLGISNNATWEVADWATTNGAGMFTAAGVFDAHAEGTHQLRIDVRGSLSNIVAFTIKDCRD